MTSIGSRPNKLSRSQRLLILGIILITVPYLIISIIILSHQYNHTDPTLNVLGIADSFPTSYEGESENPSPESFPTQLVKDNKYTNYQVAADKPRKIIIPDLNIEGFIEEVGTTVDGSMDVPTDTNIAGWFAARAKPGSPGLSIINGHKLGNTRGARGLFASLQYLTPGSTFKVQMGDNSIKNFQVTHNFQVTNQEAQTRLYQIYHDKQLNLITCVGKYLHDQQTFDHRQIVVAKTLE